jgi:hypothetical protein
MKNIISFFAFIWIIAVLNGCGVVTGEEIGRLPVNQVTTDQNPNLKETTLDLKKGDKLGIWSFMDINYEQNVNLRFKLSILKNGEDFKKFEIDPLASKVIISSRKLEGIKKTDWRFLGKYSVMKITEDGKYTFRGFLVASENPTLKITKAEVVFFK